MIRPPHVKIYRLVVVIYTGDGLCRDKNIIRFAYKYEVTYIVYFAKLENALLYIYMLFKLPFSEDYQFLQIPKDRYLSKLRY